MRACATAAMVALHRTLRNALHSFSAPSSYALFGPNLPDVWIPRENTSPHTHFPETFQWSNGNGHNNAAILEGKPIAKDIKFEVAEDIRRMRSGIGKFPRLAVVFVGDRSDSHTFINIKLKACDQVGIETVVAQFPENCTENELLDAVSSFSDDPGVHGIVVQLPLPQRHNATVSMLHAYTKNAEQITSEADIVVADVGIPNLVRGNWLKQAAVVIDMGANQVKDPHGQGFRITGDVCFEEAVKVASAITPVPGGVGPIAISMLLSNTLDSAKRAFGIV